MGTVRVSVVRFLLLYYKMLFCDGDIIYSSNSYKLFEMRNYIYIFLLLLFFTNTCQCSHFVERFLSFSNNVAIILL